MLNYLSIPSTHLNAQNSTCIFLHGLGDSGNGWASVARMLSQKLPMTKFILPHAPKKSVSLNRGAQMPAWYDILGLHEDAKQDQAGILESAKAILDIVAEEERKGIPRNKIVIGGFSQGGAIALTAGLLQQEQFAGILALSTYLPIKDHFVQMKALSKVASDTPIFMAHGTSDQVISYHWAELSRKFMVNDLKCENVKFKTLPDMGHSVNDEEIQSITKFLLKVLKY